MKVFMRFNFTTVCEAVLKEKLDALSVPYEIINFGEVDFKEPLTIQKKEEFLSSLAPYEIEIVEDEKCILVQKIKDVIKEMVYDTDEAINVKTSVYIADKVGQSYGYLSNLFSEVTYTSIEHYIILTKIEYTKHLIISEDMSLTEIAYKLDYSSVAHLSTQFKNTTGITPSAFQRIIKRRNELKSKS
ncbi:helix-turn-helix domain-containing protein [Winogradskyella litorisediminis]|uniref:Helix-turn-helix domain-containing protein n=1 Tax=Winogradskyella litorisediminis TaxID=1156618 RepID=A0ABW3N4Z7_9FLAO